MLSKIVSVIFISAIIFLDAGCKNKETPKELVLEVPVIKVVKQDVDLLSEFTGQTYGESDIQISPRVTGIIQSMDFKEGSIVKKGQLLYTVEPLTYQNNVNVAEANLAQAKSQLAAEKSDFERIDLLAKMNAVSRRELEAATAKYESGKERTNAAEAQLRNAKIDLGYCRIISPIDGVIGISKVQVGDYIIPGPLKVLTTVSSTGNIRVRFTLSEQEFLRLYRESKKDSSSLQGGNDIHLILSDGSEYEQKGAFQFADRQVDPSTGAITLEALFPNPDNLLRPGQFVRVHVEAERRKDVLLIPQRSVIEMQGIFQVYVVGSDKKVNLKIIQTGPSYKDAYVVEDGLSEGDQIAIGGTQLLRNGSTITPKIIQWQPGMPDANKEASK
jgi:membrane fusion protein (multidrug efflux system)